MFDEKLDITDANVQSLLATMLPATISEDMRAKIMSVLAAKLAEPGSRETSLVEIIDAVVVGLGITNENLNRSSGLPALLDIVEQATAEGGSAGAALEKIREGVKSGAIRVTVDPIRRQSTSVGRNERCPCGSGRKYKQCCMKK